MNTVNSSSVVEFPKCSRRVLYSDDSPTTPQGLAKSGAIFKIGNFDPKMALLCGYDVDFIAIGAVRGYFISFNDS